MSDLIAIGAETEFPPRRRRKGATAAAEKAATDAHADRFDEMTKALDAEEPAADATTPEDVENLSDTDREFLTGETPRRGFGVW